MLASRAFFILELEMGRLELSTRPLPRLALELILFKGAMLRALDFVVIVVSTLKPPSPDVEPMVFILIGFGTPEPPPPDFSRGGFIIF